MHLRINIRFFRLTLFLVLIIVLVQFALAFNFTQSWSVFSTTYEQYFGSSVSSGDFNGDGYNDVLVGAEGHYGQGRAYVYYGGPSGVSLIESWSAETGSGEKFGHSVSSGDFNGDGCDDVLVGAYLYHNGDTEEGRAYVYYGSPSGISSEPDWTAESNKEYAHFGVSVSSGDFNGDGYDDVLVGADQYKNYIGQKDGGRIFVYYGGPSGISSEANWTAESFEDYAYFGYAVSSGDFNDDGYDDVLVGDYDHDRVYVYYGSSINISSTPNWVVETGESYHDSYQCSNCLSSGDLNNDGYDDVLVGAPWHKNGETDEGCVFVYYSGPSGISSEANWTAESNQKYAYFGSSVSSGDFNGDGYDDLLIGAESYDHGETNEGRAYVYLSGPSGISSEADWTAESNKVNAYFGRSVSCGDLNNDSYDDVLVGSKEYTKYFSASGAGAAFAYSYSLQLPIYTNFISFPHTTNFSAVPDITNVANFTLETLFGMLQFPHNHSVNAEGKDLDAHIKFGDCYVAVNLSGLDYTFNATAYLTLNNSDGHCGDDRIYYAPGVYDNADAIRQHDTVCSDCIKLIADNHKVKFRVYHFSSYAIGSNANLTIYDSYENSAAQPNAAIIFYANYTNKSGSHISGATCTIYFDGNTNDKHNMTDNGNNYNYTFSFSTDGTHNYNITCSATNYNTLSAVDDVEVSSVVPEFSGSSLVVILVFVIILCLLLLNRNRK